MDQNKTALERAFELAKSGKVSNLTQLRDQIKAEGYSRAQIEGMALSRQLRRMIVQARRG